MMLALGKQASQLLPCTTAFITHTLTHVSLTLSLSTSTSTVQSQTRTLQQLVMKDEDRQTQERSQ